MNLNKQIVLPDPDFLPDISINFLELVETSSPFGKVTTKEVTFQQLSFLLWCSYGVKMVLENGIRILNIPTLSAKPLFFIYILVRNIKGLEPGTYAFSPLNHSLQACNLEIAFSGKDQFTNASYNMSVIWALQQDNTNNSDLSTQALIDVGHSCQNMYLAANALRLFCIPIYNDIYRIVANNTKNSIAVYGANIGVL